MLESRIAELQMLMLAYYILKVLSNRFYSMCDEHGYNGIIFYSCKSNF